MWSRSNDNHLESKCCYGYDFQTGSVSNSLSPGWWEGERKERWKDSLVTKGWYVNFIYMTLCGWYSCLCVFMSVVKIIKGSQHIERGQGVEGWIIMYYSIKYFIGPLVVSVVWLFSQCSGLVSFPSTSTLQHTFVLISIFISSEYIIN